MIHSDRVTSSSDDISRMMTSSPTTSAARRHGDAIPDDDIIDDADDRRNASLQSRLGYDRTHVPAQTPLVITYLFILFVIFVLLFACLLPVGVRLRAGIVR